MYISGQVGTERVPRREVVVLVASYRYQAVSVGWWRGKIKRWNTTFHASSSTQTGGIKTAMMRSGWHLASDVVGNCSGGLASITVYNAAGGVPISQSIYFDWQTPSTWIPYTSEAWSAVDPATPLDASGESAAVIVGHMSGLSASGKPVTTRKFLHAIPSRTSTNYSDPDIATSTQAALVALFPQAIMANPAGVAPSSVTCEPFYLNHQRVRGRRRTVGTVAAQSFSAGVLAGAASTGGGGGSAPQFQ